MPASARSSPHTCCTSSASWRPSTQIRERLATFGPLDVGANEPEFGDTPPRRADLHSRRGLGGLGSWRQRLDGTPLQPKAGTQREGPTHSAPILEFDEVNTAGLFDARDSSHPAGGHVLKDHADLDVYGHRTRATGTGTVSMRVVGEDITPVGICCAHPGYSKWRHPERLERHADEQRHQRSQNPGGDRADQELLGLFTRGILRDLRESNDALSRDDRADSDVRTGPHQDDDKQAFKGTNPASSTQGRPLSFSYCHVSIGTRRGSEGQRVLVIPQPARRRPLAQLLARSRHRAGRNRRASEAGQER